MYLEYFLLEALYYSEDNKLFSMKILAIETSCDDTSLAIFEDDRLLALDTKSQIKIHASTGWVVPEVAAREHANAIFQVCESVLTSAKVSIQDINYIAVTGYPGLIPSLLTGITFARTLSKILQKPLLELNHIEWHIFSNFLERKKEDIPFPLVCLTVSWGHNDIYYMPSLWEMQKIGSSQDDAAGESYDKVAKMMGLGYPGWPIISELSQAYSERKKSQLFPRVWLKKDEFNFSFSWLKSAVKREVDMRIWEQWYLSDDDKKEISFEFQNAVNEVLAYKLIEWAKEKWVSTILLAGWVSANTDLREKIREKAKENSLVFLHPIKNLYCMDNAAMIGILAYYKIKHS